MGEGRSEKKTVWIYAVILFTSAFIVLLLTAYSQIKFNKNIDEYKNQIYTEVKEKNNYQVNFNQVLESNKKLNDDLKVIKEELNKKNVEMEEMKRKNSDNESKLTAITGNYSMLLQAQSEFDKGNLVASADILYRMKDSSLLDKAGKERYDYLVGKTFKRASYQLYTEGYRSYIEGKYSNAIKILQQSYNLESKEYYSDDCLYFIAYSEYKLNNLLNTQEYVEKLMREYPDSSYIKDAGDLLKIMK